MIKLRVIYRRKVTDIWEEQPFTSHKAAIAYKKQLRAKYWLAVVQIMIDGIWVG